jgi:hypothetical protein
LKIVLAIVGAIIAPLVISLLLQAPIFSFASGNVESWISFWGSYVGALIGAATVYLVTNLQVEAQRKIQLDAIKAEHNNALKREMKQFHFKNDIDKIEELNELLEDLLDSVIKSGNEFTKYITYTHILYGGQDEYTKEQEQFFKDEIKNLYNEAYKWIHKLTKMDLKMNRLSTYIEKTSHHVSVISEQIEKYTAEIRKGYNDKQSYKNYISNPNGAALSHHFESFAEMILGLQREVLQPKLQERINEMISANNDN